MEYLRGWRALREDPQWVGKVGIGSLILLTSFCIPIVGQIALLGWMSLTLRRAVSGQDSPMPRLDFDFDYLMKLLTTGFKPFLASILWSLPIVGLVFVSYCCMYLGGMLVFGGMAAGAEAGGEGGMAAMGIISMLLSGVFLLVLVVGTFALSMVARVGVMRAEVADDINISLRFKDTINMTKMLLKELIVGSIVMSMVGFVGMLCAVFTLYIGLLPVVVILMIIQTYYRAELYKAYLMKGGEPLPVGPLNVEGGDVALVQPGGGPAQQPGSQPGAGGGYPPNQQPPGGGWGGPPAQF